MPFRVALDDSVLEKLRATPLSRNGRVRLLTNLHYDLGYHAQDYSSARLENDPSVFRYSHTLLDADRHFTATFDVSDIFEPNTLTVFDVSWRWGS